MEEQKHIVDGAGDLGGTMRLGLYPANLAEGSIVRGLYGAPSVQERHRHRYEVNNAYRDKLETAGLVSAGFRRTTSWSNSIELDRSLHPLLSLLRRRIPSCGRGRPSRIRCSRG